MNLMVILKSVYGVPKLYPANDEARALAEIAGTKTLEPRVLATAKRAFGAAVLTVNEDAAVVSKMLKEAA